MEHLIALEFLGPSTARELQGMGRFYFGKYQLEKLDADLDRALYYSLLAVDRGNNHFPYLNDLGRLYGAPGQKDKAIAELQESKKKERKQQRCYYNFPSSISSRPCPRERKATGRMRKAAQPHAEGNRGRIGKPEVGNGRNSGIDFIDLLRQSVLPVQTGGNRSNRGELAEATSR